MRLRTVDVARGIAIISVILGHLGSSEINRVVFTYHLPVFYLITGYFMNARKPLSRFVLDKARTLLVPYCIACAAMIVSGALFSYWSGGAERAFEAAGKWFRASLFGSGVAFDSPFHVESIGALWFLWATLWGSLLLKLSLKLKPWMRLAMIVGIFYVALWSIQCFWLPYSFQTGCCAALFMYFGYLARQAEEQWKNQNWEVKAAATVFAFMIWFAFIRDFKSFWLVQLDLGRGMIDIFSSLCASWCIFKISAIIDRKLPVVNSFLAYFGRYSILVLCVHIIELNTFPWNAVIKVIGVPQEAELLFKIVCKLLLDLGVAAVLSRIGFIRNLFGLKSK